MNSSIGNFFSSIQMDCESFLQCVCTGTSSTPSLGEGGEELCRRDKVLSSHHASHLFCFGVTAH